MAMAKLQGISLGRRIWRIRGEGEVDGGKLLGERNYE